MCRYFLLNRPQPIAKPGAGAILSAYVAAHPDPPKKPLRARRTRHTPNPAPDMDGQPIASHRPADGVFSTVSGSGV
jgi:hypothetical protein